MPASSNSYPFGIHFRTMVVGGGSTKDRNEWMSDILGKGRVDEARQNVCRHEAPSIALASVRSISSRPGNSKR